MAQITDDTLASWNACEKGRKWFRAHFPQGGAYNEVQAALRANRRYEWSSWLTTAAFAAALKDPAGIAALATDEVSEALEATKGSPNSSSGDGSKAASSGYGSKAASSGDGSKAASSGNGSTAASSGYGSKAASSGDYSKAASSGEATIAMVAGQNGRAKAGPNGCVALVWHDGQRNRIAVGYVGEDGIKADTWYRLDAAGRFVEADV